jgi:hypothetical protein
MLQMALFSRKVFNSVWCLHCVKIEQKFHCNRKPFYRQTGRIESSIKTVYKYGFLENEIYLVRYLITKIGSKEIQKFEKVFLYKLALSNFFFLYICVPKHPHLSAPLLNISVSICRGRSVASFLFQESDRKIGILIRCICYIYGFKISARSVIVDCIVPIVTVFRIRIYWIRILIQFFCCILIRTQAVAESGSGFRPRIFLAKCLSKIRI